MGVMLSLEVVTDFKIISKLLGKIITLSTKFEYVKKKLAMVLSKNSGEQSRAMLALVLFVRRFTLLRYKEHL